MSLAAVPTGARCAAYYTPPAEHPLTRRAACWLGRDAFSGEDLQRPDIGLADLDLSALTDDPRGYGFHATMRAPFVAAGPLSDVDAALTAFCLGRRPFEVRLHVINLKGFLALTLAEPSSDMQALHEDLMGALEPVRAPLSAFDRARRAKGDADLDHDARLDRWGYPHVFSHFTFHMTLTGRIRDPGLQDRVRAALEGHFADLLAAPHRIEGLGLFVQPDRAAPFRVAAWRAFGG